MLDRLQSFFQSVMQDRPKAVFAPDDPRIAVAALCLQVMEADGVVRDAEKANKAGMADNATADVKKI